MSVTSLYKTYKQAFTCLGGTVYLYYTISDIVIRDNYLPSIKKSIHTDNKKDKIKKQTTSVRYRKASPASLCRCWVTGAATW